MRNTEWALACGRREDGGLRKQIFVADAHVAAPRHHQDHVRSGGNDGLVGQRLVTLKVGDGIHPASKANDPVRGGVGAARHDTPALHRQHKEHPARRASRFLGCDLCRLIQIGGHIGSQSLALLGHAQNLGDVVNLGQHGLAVIAFGDFRELDAGGFEQFDGFGRARAFLGDDERGVHRQHTLRRQAPDVADVGQLRHLFGEVRGGVAGHQAILLAKGVDDLGHRAADRDDALRLLGLQRTGHQQGQRQHGPSSTGKKGRSKARERGAHDITSAGAASGKAAAMASNSAARS